MEVAIDVGNAGATAKTIGAAMADDLELLALLHDRELTTGMIAALKAAHIEQQLTLRLAGPEYEAAVQAFRDAVDELPDATDGNEIDGLAVAYADIYFRNVFRAAPTESVWLTEDGLERQAPMMVIRAEHRRFNARFSDDAKRAEDHLVPQLRFVAFLLRREDDDALAVAAKFLDEHLMRWLKDFARRLVGVGAHAFYQALAVLTASYVDGMREILADLSGVRHVAAPVADPAPTARGSARDSEPDPRYLPGFGPSW